VIVGPAVSFLADLAGTGSALELGIGAGRIALQLSRRGVRVHGIELSPAMVVQLRTKLGAADIGVTIGDFATTKVAGTFTLAYLVRDTITSKSLSRITTGWSMASWRPSPRRIAACGPPSWT
jgi:16S rRNA A1518/A1519 N6-dimethyltransferase RsmA/KsgA/DIM1 with predicted DNA glycosylase/AP lyase activity